MKVRLTIILTTGVLIYSCVGLVGSFAKSINSVPMQKSFIYSGRDPFLDLAELNKLNNEKKNSTNNANKDEIIARIQSISVLGLMVGELGKRAIISSNGKVSIVKIGEKLGENAKVVDIGSSSITIKGTYKTKKKLASVKLKLELRAP